MWIIRIFKRLFCRRKKKILQIRVLFHHHTKKHTMSLNSITLTDLLPHTGVVSVIDQNNNTYSGKLSNIQVTVADASMDSAQADPNQANTIDVTAIVNSGGTTASITADFTSDQPINGQTSFTGLKGQITIINQVAAQVQLSLSVSF